MIKLEDVIGGVSAAYNEEVACESEVDAVVSNKAVKTRLSISVMNAELEVPALLSPICT